MYIYIQVLRVCIRSSKEMKCSEISLLIQSATTHSQLVLIKCFSCYQDEEKSTNSTLTVYYLIINFSYILQVNNFLPILVMNFSKHPRSGEQTFAFPYFITVYFARGYIDDQRRPYVRTLSIARRFNAPPPTRKLKM